MKKFFSLTLTLAATLSAMAVSAQAADYSFETDGTPEYYPSSSYEDVYGSRYNYGGKNVVDYCHAKTQQKIATCGKAPLETVQREMDSSKSNPEPSSSTPTIQTENSLYQIPGHLCRLYSAYLLQMGKNST